MVWRRSGDSSWVWQLAPCPDGSTRLISRIRSRIRRTPTSVIFNVLLEVADFWMLRKMLLNLRERSESHVEAESTRTEPTRVVQRKRPRTGHELHRRGWFRSGARGRAIGWKERGVPAEHLQTERGQDLRRVGARHPERPRDDAIGIREDTGDRFPR